MTKNPTSPRPSEPPPWEGLANPPTEGLSTTELVYLATFAEADLLHTGAEG